MKRGKPEKYIALAETIRLFIKEKRLKKGDSLPSERILSDMFSVNHLTLRKALRLLEQENLIYKEPSRGNFVGTKPLLPGKNGIVGFIFPDDEVFYYKIFAELERFLSEAGLHPVVHITNNIKEKEEKILDFMIASGAEALIAAPNSQCAGKYRDLKIPVIFYDLFIPGLNIPHIISDDYDGAEKITEHLVSLGHSRIAHVSGTYEHTSELRLKGYLDVLKKHGIEVPGKYIKCKEPSREWGYYAAKELTAMKSPPTAILCGNDTIAAGVFRLLSSKGIRVPDDCSLCGFGNTTVAEDLDLTSVSQHTPKIADAIRNNLQIILRGETPSPETVINTTLIVRRSTARPPKQA
ncbi:MAG: GntR family transcriptional regulator [Lentisphaerota bacterium]